MTDCQENAIYKNFSNKLTKLKALSKQKYYETLKESVRKPSENLGVALHTTTPKV